MYWQCVFSVCSLSLSLSPRMSTDLDSSSASCNSCHDQTLKVAELSEDLRASRADLQASQLEVESLRRTLGLDPPTQQEVPFAQQQNSKERRNAALMREIPSPSHWETPTVGCIKKYNCQILICQRLHFVTRHIYMTFAKFRENSLRSRGSTSHHYVFLWRETAGE